MHSGLAARRPGNWALLLQPSFTVSAHPVVESAWSYCHVLKCGQMVNASMCKLMALFCGLHLYCDFCLKVQFLLEPQAQPDQTFKPQSADGPPLILREEYPLRLPTKKKVCAYTNKDCSSCRHDNTSACCWKQVVAVQTKAFNFVLAVWTSPVCPWLSSRPLRPSESWLIISPGRGL